MKINHKTATEFRNALKYKQWTIPKDLEKEEGFERVENFMNLIIDAYEAAEKDVKRYAGPGSECVDCGYSYPDHANYCELK